MVGLKLLKNKFIIMEKNYDLLKHMIVAGGDAGVIHAIKIVEEVKQGTFEGNDDPIAAVLVRTLEDPDYLDYALHQLGKAKIVNDAAKAAAGE